MEKAKEICKTAVSVLLDVATVGTGILMACIGIGHYFDGIKKLD